MYGAIGAKLARNGAEKNYPRAVVGSEILVLTCAVITEGGKTIWLAGHVGFIDDTGAAPALAGNFDAQVRQAFKNLEKTLQRAGGTLKDVVWMTVAVSDGRYSQRFTDIRKEIYGSEFPASTLLTAASFAVPEIMVEITPIAVVAA